MTIVSMALQVYSLFLSLTRSQLEFLAKFTSTGIPTDFWQIKKKL